MGFPKQIFFIECDSHKPIAVKLKKEETFSDIDSQCWYKQIISQLCRSHSDCGFFVVEKYLQIR